MPITEEELKTAQKLKTDNSQLAIPPGHSRINIPGQPSLPLRDNNYSALNEIAKSLGGTIDFVSDKE